MNDGIKIIAVTPIEGQPITKTAEGRSKGFILPVHYTLEDGRKVVADVYASKKRDIQRNLEWAKASANNGGFRATLNAAGELSGTITSIGL